MGTIFYNASAPPNSALAHPHFEEYLDRLCTPFFRWTLEDSPRGPEDLDTQGVAGIYCTTNRAVPGSLYDPTCPAWRWWLDALELKFDDARLILRQIWPQGPIARKKSPYEEYVVLCYEEGPIMAHAEGFKLLEVAPELNYDMSLEDESNDYRDSPSTSTTYEVCYSTVRWNNPDALSKARLVHGSIPYDMVEFAVSECMLREDFAVEQGQPFPNIKVLAKDGPGQPYRLLNNVEKQRALRVI